jgi:hypothetical protein
MTGGWDDHGTNDSNSQVVIFVIDSRDNSHTSDSHLLISILTNRSYLLAYTSQVVFPYCDQTLFPGAELLPLAG